MIVDEVDAFPFSYDRSLQLAVEKARTPEASTIYLTATPDKQTQYQCKKGKRTFISNPRTLSSEANPPAALPLVRKLEKSP